MLTDVYYDVSGADIVMLTDVYYDVSGAENLKKVQSALKALLTDSHPEFVEGLKCVTHQHGQTSVVADRTKLQTDVWHGINNVITTGDY